MQPRPRSGLRGYRAPGSRPKRRSRSLEPGCKMRRTGSFGRTPGRPNRPEPGTNTHTGQTRWQESAWSVKQDKINPAVKPLLLFLAKFNLTRLLFWKTMLSTTSTCGFYNIHTHQQHEVIEPLARLIELHGADPRSLESCVVCSQRDVHRVRVGHHERDAHPLFTQARTQTIWLLAQLGIFFIRHWGRQHILFPRGFLFWVKYSQLKTVNSFAVLDILNHIKSSLSADLNGLTSKSTQTRSSL